MKEKLQWIFRFYDISDDGKLTKQVRGNLEGGEKGLLVLTD